MELDLGGEIANILAAFGFDVSAPVLILAFVYAALIGVLAVPLPESMVSILAELPAESRELLMRSNAACLGELPEDARREVMKAMMTSVSELLGGERRPVMQTMAGLVSA